MKINVNNTVETAKALDTVQKGCTAGLIIPSELIQLAKDAEAYMDRFGVLKSDRSGCQYDYAEHVGCNSYGLNYADSTHVTLERGNKDWFLVSCERVSPPPTSRGPRDSHFRATKKALASAMAQLGKNLERV